MADGDDQIKNFPADAVRSQIAACLTAWGMPEDQVEITADVMVDADKCGIDTHGLSMLTTYDFRRRWGLVISEYCQPSHSPPTPPHGTEQ